MHKILIVVALIVIIAFGGYQYSRTKQVLVPDSVSSLGSYEYQCNDGATVSVVPSEDVSKLALTLHKENTSVNEVLVKVEGAATEFIGPTYRFLGAGETITLSTESVRIACSPVSSPETPPWNWGDPTTPETSATSDEMPVGALVGIFADEHCADSCGYWEFRENGTLVDRFVSYEHEGERAGTLHEKTVQGTWAIVGHDALPTAPASSKEETYLRALLPVDAWANDTAGRDVWKEGEALYFKIVSLTEGGFEFLSVPGGHTWRFVREVPVVE
jgi:hypothetical protein